MQNKLKKEIDIEKEIPNLRECVTSSIKNFGEYCVICDTHIRDISPRFSIPYRYWTPICDWARKEGLYVSTHYNSYGVKHLVITL